MGQPTALELAAPYKERVTALDLASYKGQATAGWVRPGPANCMGANECGRPLCRNKLGGDEVEDIVFNQEPDGLYMKTVFTFLCYIMPFYPFLDLYCSTCVVW